MRHRWLGAVLFLVRTANRLLLFGLEMLMEVNAVPVNNSFAVYISRKYERQIDMYRRRCGAGPWSLDVYVPGM